MFVFSSSVCHRGSPALCFPRLLTPPTNETTNDSNYLIVVNIEEEMLENEDVGAIIEGDVSVVCQDLQKKRTLEAKPDQKRTHFAEKVR